MKILHQHLLVVSAPYLVLALLAWNIPRIFIEPAERQRIRSEAQQELRLHAALIRQNIQRLTSQLRLMSELPAFQSGNQSQAQAELKRLNERHDESFAAIYFHNLQLQTLAADGANIIVVSPMDESRLAQGEVVVTDIRTPGSNGLPAVYVMVPVHNELGQPLYAMVGELSVASFWPMLDPNQVKYTGDYSLVDTQGHELTANQIKTSSQPTQRMNPQWNDQLLRSNDIERFSTSVPPWNWQLNKYVTFPLALGALWFQSDLLTVLCVFCSFFAAGGIYVLQRVMSRRFSKMIETIQSFGASDLSVRSKDQASDELGQLAEAFNCMADDIVHANRKLQKQLAEQERSPTLWKQQSEDLQAKIAELDRFASSAAHELKAPLVTMQGFAKGLEPAAKAGDWDRFHDDVHRIQRAGQDLSAMVDALLALAKTGQDVILTADVSLYRAATDAVELLRGRIDQRHIDVSITRDLPTVKGNPILWRNVFQNLIDNAIQACDDVASPKIEIGCEQRDGQTVCYVRDNGDGIDPNENVRIFEMFSQGRGKSAGSGIGLALVKRIIELHGGKVWAEGDVTGTTIVWTVGN